MTYIAVSDKTVCVIFPKVGSMSIRSALGKIPHQQVTAKEALNYEERVAFYRDPVERLNSMFNMCWWGIHNNSNMTELVPDGVILAYGGKVSSPLRGFNSQRWTVKDEQKLQLALTAARDENPNISDRNLTRLLDQQDYERFVDHILVEQDPHWDSQVSLATDEGVLVPNISYRFEDINKEWSKHIGGTLPVLNHWEAVTKNPHKLGSLNQFYARDISKRAEIASNNPGNSGRGNN